MRSTERSRRPARLRSTAGLNHWYNTSLIFEYLNIKLVEKSGSRFIRFMSLGGTVNSQVLFVKWFGQPRVLAIFSLFSLNSPMPHDFPGAFCQMFWPI